MLQVSTSDKFVAERLSCPLEDSRESQGRCKSHLMAESPRNETRTFHFSLILNGS